MHLRKRLEFILHYQSDKYDMFSYIKITIYLPSSYPVLTFFVPDPFFLCRYGAKMERRKYVQDR